MEIEMDPRQPIFTPRSLGQRLTHIAGGASIVAFSVTAWWVWEAFQRGGTDGQTDVIRLAAAWGVAAPAWFWFEYFYLYRRDGVRGSLELYKHGQQLSFAIWVAVVTALGVIASSEHFKKAEEKQCIAAAARASQAASAPPAPGTSGPVPAAAASTAASPAR